METVEVHVAQAPGTASGATTNAAGYAMGVKTVTLASAGTGTILVDDIIQFAGDGHRYTVTSGDADVSNGGTISFTPGLRVAMSAATKAITVVSNQRFVGAGRLQGIHCRAGTTPSVTIYDNASAASGKVLYATGTMTIGQSIMFPGDGLPFANGLHCVVAGSATPTFNLWRA